MGLGWRDTFHQDDMPECVLCCVIRVFIDLAIESTGLWKLLTELPNSLLTGFQPQALVSFPTHWGAVLGAVSVSAQRWNVEVDAGSRFTTQRLLGKYYQMVRDVYCKQNRHYFLRTELMQSMLQDVHVRSISQSARFICFAKPMHSGNRGGPLCIAQISVTTLFGHQLSPGHPLGREPRGHHHCC